MAGHPCPASLQALSDGVSNFLKLLEKFLLERRHLSGMCPMLRRIVGRRGCP